jgi:hypothetical protein
LPTLPLDRVVQALVGRLFTVSSSFELSLKWTRCRHASALCLSYVVATRSQRPPGWLSGSPLIVGLVVTGDFSQLQFFACSGLAEVPLPNFRSWPSSNW